MPDNVTAAGATAGAAGNMPNDPTGSVAAQRPRWFARLGVRDSALALVVLSALLGTSIGFAVAILHEAVALAQSLAFALPEESRLGSVRPDLLHALAVPALGGLILGVLVAVVRRWRPRDIVDAVEANALYGGKMSLTDSLRLTATTALSNGSGASVGMEAAYTQAGSGFASSLGQRLHLRRSDLRTLVGCGAAAAIAAAYQAPLAGAFYAFELVLGGYTLANLAPVGAAAVAAVAVSGLLAAPGVPMEIGRPVVVAGWDYAVCGAVGFAAGWLSIAAMQAVTLAERGFRALPLPRWLHPALGGLSVGAIALWVPEVLGAGPGTARPELADGAAIVAVLLLAKVLASAISLGSGFRGGLFSASLFIGGLFGGLAVSLLTALAPDFPVDRELLVLVGMGSVAAGVVGAPVTMVLLVLESTQDLWAASGVMIGVVASIVVVRHAFGYSFSTWRFHLRGVPIRGAYDVGWLSELTALRLMRADVSTALATQSVEALRRAYPLGSAKLIFATDSQGLYAGMVDMSAAHDPELDLVAAETTVGSLARHGGVALYPGDDIRCVLERLCEAEVEALPVLAAPGDRRIVGYVTEAFALRRYSQALEKQRSEDLGEQSLWGRG